MTGDKRLRELHDQRVERADDGAEIGGALHAGFAQGRLRNRDGRELEIAVEAAVARGPRRQDPALTRVERAMRGAVRTERDLMAGLSGMEHADRQIGEDEATAPRRRPVAGGGDARAGFVVAGLGRAPGKMRRQAPRSSARHCWARGCAGAAGRCGWAAAAG